MVERNEPVRRQLLWTASGLVAVVTFAFRWLSFTAFHNDHFDHVARAQQILLGDWPIRDFVDPGFFGMYLVSAAGQWVTGEVFRTELAISAAGFAIAAALTFRLAWLLSQSWTVALATTALQLLLYPRTYSYPKLLVLAVALSVGWHVRTHLTYRRISALAAATVFGYYYRHDLGVYVALGCLTLICVRRRIASLGEPRHAVMSYVAACVLLIAPHLVYVEGTVGVVRYFQTALHYSEEEATRGLGLGLPPLRVNIRWTPGVSDAFRVKLEQQYGLRQSEFREQRTWRYTPADRSSQTIAALLHDPHVEDTHNFDQLRPGPRLRALAAHALQPQRTLWSSRNGVQWLFWTWCVLPAIGAITLWQVRNQLPSSDLRWVAMLIVLAAATALGFLRSPLPARVPDVGVPMTLLGAWLAWTQWHRQRAVARQILARSAIVACGLVLSASIGLAYNAPALVLSTGVPQGPAAVVARWQAVSRVLTADRVPIAGSSKAMRRAADYVRDCTTTTDRVLYAGYAPEFFVLAGRGFAGGQITFTGRFHASPAEQEIALARLRNEHVPILLIPEHEGNSFSEVYEHLWAFVGDRYTRVTTLSDKHQPLEIWVASDRSVPAPWNEEEWPCLV